MILTPSDLSYNLNLKLGSTLGGKVNIISSSEKSIRVLQEPDETKQELCGIHTIDDPVVT